MRPVDEHRDAPRLQDRDEPLHGKDERGRARHVADERQPCPGRHCPQDALHDIVRAIDGERNPRQHDPGTGVSRADPQRIERRVVLVVGGEKLVARADPERAEDRRNAGGRVRHEREVVRVRADEGADRGPSSGEPVVQTAGEEGHRVRFHLRAEGLLGGKDAARAGAE